MNSRWVMVLLSALLLLPPLAGVATADHEWDHRYEITGTVTDPDGDPVHRQTVSLDCSQGATHVDICEHNEGRKVKTSLFSGEYTLKLHVHSSNHGKLFVVLVEGEQFNHTIDLEGADGAAEVRDRFKEMNIELSSSVDYTMDLIGIGVVMTLLVASIAFILRKIGYRPMAAKRETDVSARKKAQDEDLLDSCPRCDAKVKPKNMLRHLTQKHHLPKAEAENLIDDSKNAGDELE